MDGIRRRSGVKIIGYRPARMDQKIQKHTWDGKQHFHIKQHFTFLRKIS
jgi:hypothetical protein